MNRVYSIEQAIGHVREQKKSGLSMSEYARRNNLKFTTLHGWSVKHKNRLKDETEAKEIPALIPVRVSEVQQNFRETPSTNRLRFSSGHVLEFQAEISPNFIAEIAKVLK